MIVQNPRLEVPPCRNGECPEPEKAKPEGIGISGLNLHVRDNTGIELIEHQGSYWVRLGHVTEDSCAIWVDSPEQCKQLAIVFNRLHSKLS